VLNQPFSYNARMSRIEEHLSFILEIDKLKSVIRQTLLCDSSRRENSAEHSWHLAIMAMLLTEYAAEPVDVMRAMKMVLVHDIVEIDAGDVFAYDAAGNVGKVDREKLAAERIFGMLPEEQGQELRELWEEFEARATPEAKYANALDRLQPLLHNSRTQGGTWAIHKVNRKQVMWRMDPVREGMPEIWPVVLKIVDEACGKKWIGEAE
jgi:putative hydrolase of HD superfamily